LLASARLLAITVTACGLLMVAGAVYIPLITVPIGGTRDHVTPCTFVPLTEAVNVADSPAFKDADEGVTFIAMGLV
jgi:hypothetical protein